MPTTTTYQPGNRVLVAFPFAGGGLVKRGPALVILDNGDSDVVARDTTRLYQTTFDVPLTDWQSAVLLARAVWR